MAIHLTPEANPTVQEGTLYVDSATGEFNVAGRTTPHIIPGVLYPAVSGNDLSGTALGGSYVYGTAHTDGRKYYYTDIKGSKPIKDPRIGGHFGSQRYKLKSFQKLEQETATHGQDVYSVDGREWIRATGTDLRTYNDTAGNFLGHGSGTSFFEFVGYFSDANYANFTTTNERDIQVSVDGGNVTTNTIFNTTAVTPLSSRYVDACSFANLGLGLTLGIHTLKINVPSGEYSKFYAIELIAQDTTSTANRSKIQIPSQDVVSYGKKFTVSGTPHYNPFNNQTIGDNTSHGKNTVGWTTYDSTLDTATSLGLDAWVNSGNYYRPVNGGRVVKWVDSSGNIKTSVNMMPPSAKAFGSHSGNSGPHQTAWTSTYQPVFSSGSVDHSQAEVSKTFHFREFGNGSANEGTGGANYADASMLNTGDDIAYVMDDGLTSFTADNGNIHSSGEFLPEASNDYWYLTFIGTGVTLKTTNYAVGTYQIAQNLPYGTHVLKGLRDADGTPDYTIDGVAIDDVSGSTYAAMSEITFHQPKKPPIPEDAVVIADYMLMADYVKTTNADNPSKGIRRINCSRDWFYNSSDNTAFTAHTTVSPDPANSGSWGLKVGKQSAWNASLPYFGTQIGVTFEDNTDSGHGLLIDGSSVEGTKDSLNNASHGYADMWIPTATVTLGVHTIKAEHRSGGYRWVGGEVATPIHTSSHYQSFETPFLHELIGGDRNMEQTNLVCSPDGKTWDELTRDVSYIGNMVCSMNTATSTTWSSRIIFDDWRGHIEGKDMFNKDFAIAYDTLICLKTGFYLLCDVGVFSGHREWYLNGVHTTLISDGTSASSQTPVFLQRGDELYINGDYGEGTDVNRRYTHAYILRSNA